jgi:multiple sugar transport system ATP-binding protein
MAEVTLEKIKKVYEGNVTAVYESDLEINDKEFMVMVGPSGCGKSTTLRMIAGLEEISGGTLSIGDKVVNDIPPKDRDIAMVFQNYALYPHMTVFDNMAFGLKLRKYPKDQIKDRVNEAAKSLGLEEYLDRKPKALSGGQRQRVALGRAIVRQPAVFLLDEPLSNLDAKMRISMRKELHLLHQRLKTTMIYVTHDQVEAMTLGDRICVMSEGYIQQVGKPLDVYDFPANKFVAGFIGTPTMNFIEGSLESDGSSTSFKTAAFTLKLSDAMHQKLDGQAVSAVTFGVRPESFSLSEGAVENAVEATVEVMEKLGDSQILYVKSGDSEITAKIDSHIAVSPGDKVHLLPNLDRCHIFGGEGEKNLTS